MADKFVKGLSPGMPLADAARHVLGCRLDGVAGWLASTLSVGTPGESESRAECIHQLRVATRRADAAFRIFRSCLPGHVYREGRERLRTIRRAAGAARDWDVFLDALRQRGKRKMSPPERPGLDFLIAYSLGRRHAAQGAIDGLATSQPTSFREFQAATLEEVRPGHSERESVLEDLAGPALSRLAARMAEAASHDLANYELLHRVRIAGKRLRYAMEVFGCCRDGAFREKLYPRVEEMQEILGRANDSHVAQARLAGIRADGAMLGSLWQRVEPGIKALARMHARRLPQERRRFLKWWEQWRKEGLA